MILLSYVGACDHMEAWFCEFYNGADNIGLKCNELDALLDKLMEAKIELDRRIKSGEIRV